MSKGISNNLSCSETFASLYNCAQSRPAQSARSEQQIMTHQMAMRVFFTYCRGGNCEEVRGRLLYVNFASFPTYLPTKTYDCFQGKGAAKKALHETPTYFQKKTYETYKNCRRCDYFDEKSMTSLSKEDWEEFKTQFETCRVLNKNLEITQQRFQRITLVKNFFSHCTADYTVRQYDSLKAVGHRGRNCKETLQDLRLFLDETHYINDFQVCLTPNLFQGVSGLSYCRSASGSMGVNDVVGILSDIAK